MWQLRSDTDIQCVNLTVPPISCPASLQLFKNTLWLFHLNRGPLFQVTLGNSVFPYPLPSPGRTARRKCVRKWGPGGYTLVKIETTVLNFGLLGILWKVIHISQSSWKDQQHLLMWLGVNTARGFEQPWQSSCVLSCLFAFCLQIPMKRIPSHQEQCPNLKHCGAWKSFEASQMYNNLCLIFWWFLYVVMWSNSNLCSVCVGMS